jgi:Fe-S cluster assembly iron-binding protein IscA
MALDEPKEDDHKYDNNALTFVMAPDVEQIVSQSGGVVIDYVDDGFRKGYTLRLGNTADDCGGCSGGDCG